MLQQKILSVISDFFDQNDIPIKNKISLEFSKYADLATNAAMISAKFLKKSPKEVFDILKENLLKIQEIEKIEFLKGFINITISKNEYIKNLITCLNQKTEYGIVQNKTKNVNLEHGSMNPTGMIHVGHSRIIIFGESLARLLSCTGYNVTREYLINDAGRQVNELAESVLARYYDLYKVEHDFKIFYPDEQLINIACEVQSKFGDIFLNPNNNVDFSNNIKIISNLSESKDDEEYVRLHKSACKNCLKKMSQENIIKFFKSYSIINIMKDIIKDCALLNIRYDIFFSEQKMHENDEIKKTINKINTNEEILTSKFSKKGEITNKKIKIFKPSNEEAYPLTKANGEWTYLAADIAYHYSKIQRGFCNMINIWGADHDNHIKRVKSAIKQINPHAYLNVIPVQMMSINQSGENLKISKRSGTMIKVRDILKQTSSNMLKFCILQKTPDSHFTFDTSLKKIDDLFYINYAYTRINSIVKKANNVFCENFENYDLNLLKMNQFNNINKKHMKPIFQWPTILQLASDQKSLKKICVFLHETAKVIHDMWTLKPNQNNKIIDINNKYESYAKILFMIAIRNIMKKCAYILNVELNEFMN